MPIQVIADHRPEQMATAVYVYRVDTDQFSRRVLKADGHWSETSAGEISEPTFVLPDDVMPHLLQSLGMPMSDAHLLDALRHERTRVDKMVDAMTEAVTRGL